jgi:ADP-heptose:LPS heptosyltransferase
MLKRINALRRKIMRSLTRNIGRSAAIISPATTPVRRILVCRPNHRLGNQLLITPLIQEIGTTFPGCKIDLFVKGGLAPVLFSNYENIDRIIRLPRKPFKELIQYFRVWITIKKRKYDIVINAVEHSSSGKIATKIANATYKFFGTENDDTLLAYADHTHMAKHPVYNFRENMGRLGYAQTKGPVSGMDIKLSVAELLEGKKLLHDLAPNEQRTISLFTYATGAKCYSAEWWLAFYERLKATYPGYNIIEILPVENISNISFKAPSFYSKDIRAIGSLMANTAIFIGADSGMMHLASASQVPTVGLFSITKPGAYQPYNNNSIGLDTNETDMDECMRVVARILGENTT